MRWNHVDGRQNFWKHPGRTAKGSEMFAEKTPTPRSMANQIVAHNNHLVTMYGVNPMEAMVSHYAPSLMIVTADDVMKAFEDRPDLLPKILDQFRSLRDSAYQLDKAIGTKAAANALKTTLTSVMMEP